MESRNRSFSSPESRTCNGSPRSQKLKEAEPRHANQGLVLWFTLPGEPDLQMCCKADKLTDTLYPWATCSTRSFQQWRFTVKKDKKVISFSAEPTGSTYAVLITRRKEVFKLKTRGLAPMPGRKDLTQDMGEKLIKSGFSRGSHLFISYLILSLLAVHVGTPLISVIYRLK